MDNNDSNAPKSGSPVLKVLGIGCLVVVVLGIVLGYGCYSKVKEATAKTLAAADAVETDLQDNGFVNLGGGKISAKGAMEFLKNVAEPKTIATPNAKKTYCAGKSLAIDAECNNDVLFLAAGDENNPGFCNVNKSVNANLCVLVMGKTDKFTVNVAKGVTVKKLFTTPGVKVNNDGAITEGVVTSIKDFYNFDKVLSLLKEKYGDTTANVASAIIHGEAAAAPAAPAAPAATGNK